MKNSQNLSKEMKKFLNTKVKAGSIYLYIDKDRNYTFAIPNTDRASKDAYLIKLDNTPVSLQDQPKFTRIINQDGGVNVFGITGTWNGIDIELANKMSHDAIEKLLSLFDSWFMDCNPYKSIKLGKLLDMEEELSNMEGAIRKPRTETVTPPVEEQPTSSKSTIYRSHRHTYHIPSQILGRHIGIDNLDKVEDMERFNHMYDDDEFYDDSIN